MSLKLNLAAIFLSALTGGCATMCDKTCQLENSARAMAGSSDVGMRASAAITLGKIHSEIADSNAHARLMGLPQSIECTVSSVEVADGRKVVKMTGCAKPAEAKPRQS